MSVGIIGFGRMGKCLAEGMVQSGNFSKADIFFTTSQPQIAAEIAAATGFTSCDSNTALAKTCDTLILAVKPQNVKTVLEDLRGAYKNQLLISIAASIRTDVIESILGPQSVVIRAMPNTPAFVRQGVTPLCRGIRADSKAVKAAESIFASVGVAVEAQEKYFDAITGLSGCGPAYLYLILEALTEAGIKVGLPRELCSLLAAQTMLGAAQMLLSTRKHPAALKDEVTTPGGCTIDALLELEEGKLRSTMIRAVVAATEKAEKLSKLS